MANQLQETDQTGERLKFERRHAEYKWLADEQIQAILTALSISEVNGKHATWITDEEEEEQDCFDTLSSTPSLTVAAIEENEDELVAKAFIFGVAQLIINDEEMADQNEPALDYATVMLSQSAENEKTSLLTENSVNNRYNSTKL